MESSITFVEFAQQISSLIMDSVLLVQLIQFIMVMEDAVVSKDIASLTDFVLKFVKETKFSRMEDVDVLKDWDLLMLILVVFVPKVRSLILLTRSVELALQTK